MNASSAATVAGVSDAVGVYSLRKLVDSYTGAAINVRRSSDGTTMDIGFDGSGNLDTAALLGFVGSGDGYVTTWYDQAETGGAGTGASDPDLSDQPQIVSAGVVNTGSNGLAAVSFSGSQALANNAYTGLSTTSVLAVAAFNGPTGANSVDERLWSMPNGTDSTRLTLGGNSNTYTSGHSNNGSFGFASTGVAHDTTGLAFQASLIADGSGAGSTDTINTYINGASVQSLSGRNLSSDAVNFIIGAQLVSGTRGLDGNVQEILVFNTLLSAGDRATLEANQMALYLVPEPSASLLAFLALPALYRRRRKV